MLTDWCALFSQLGYRDKAWSVNRLGAVARRHGYGEACLRIINSLYGFNAMEVQEAFIKIREQVRWSLSYCPPVKASWRTLACHLSPSFQTLAEHRTTYHQPRP